jgi:hypothetical protein
LALYEQLCADRAKEDSAFWAEGMRAILLLPAPSLLGQTGEFCLFFVLLRER